MCSAIIEHSLTERLFCANHLQAVRHARPILIQAASAAPHSCGTLHPSIINTRRPVAISGGGSCAGNTLSAGITATEAVPATKVLRSIIMRLLLRDPSIHLPTGTAGTRPH